MGIKSANKAGTVRKRVRVQQNAAQKPNVQQQILALAAQFDAATQKGVGRAEWLSQKEATGLISVAQKSAEPRVVDALKNLFTEALDAALAGGNGLKLGNAALDVICAFLEVAPATYRVAAQGVDAQATHNLGEGLVKEKAQVSTGQQAKTKNEIEQYRITGQTGRAVSKNEFTPASKASRAVDASFEDFINNFLAENAPGMKAAKDAVEPAVKDMVQGTVLQLGKNPDAMKRLAGVLGKVGKEGFLDAIQSAVPDIGKAFAEATGVAAVNPDVLGPLLQNLPKMAETFAPKIAGNVAQACATCATKFGLQGAEALGKVALKEGAEALGKVALKEGAEAVGKVVVKEGAEAIAKTGVKAAAKSGGKAIPIIGNVLSFGSACLAGAGLVKELFNDPRDGEKIAKAGLNTLAQTVGVAFPWVGLAGDVVDMGWSAKIGMSAASAGQAEAPGASKKEIAALASGPARHLATLLDGAGKGGVADAFRQLASATDAAADAPVLRKAEFMALSQFAQMNNQELTKAAATETGETKEALTTLAHGFGEVFKVLYQNRKLKAGDDVKAGQVKGQLMGILGDVAMAAGALYLKTGQPTPLAAAD